MALLDKENRNLILGAGLGAGALLVIPYVRPVLAAVARPLLKALIGQGMLGFEAVTAKLAEAAESLQDLIADVQAERAQGDLPVRESAPPRREEPNPGAN